MVTKTLIHPAFKCIRFADFLNIIPVGIHVKSGKLSSDNRLLARIVHNVLFTLAAAKTAHIAFALIQLALNFQPERFPVFILTALWLSLSTTATFWSSELFHRGLDETILLFNSLEFEAPTGKLSLKRVIRQLGKLNLQELLCVATPFAVKMFVPLYVALMLVFPHWDIFSTSLVHENKEASWSWMTGMFITFEVLTAFYTESNILFLFFFQLALQITHLAEFGAINKRIKMKVDEGQDMDEDALRSNLRTAKFFHVFITLCSVLFSQILFTGKLMAITCSVLGTYYILCGIQSSAIFIIFFGALSFQAIAFYTVSCEKLFAIPGYFEQCKHSSLQMLNGMNVMPWERKLYNHQIRAIPVIGLKDGSFGVLQSVSTLLFVDIYINSVISLLLL